MDWNLLVLKNNQHGAPAVRRVRRTGASRTVRYWSVWGSMVWGLVELVALQRSRFLQRRARG